MGELIIIKLSLNMKRFEHIKIEVENISSKVLMENCKNLSLWHKNLWRINPFSLWLFPSQLCSLGKRIGKL